jgi:rhamnosyltransferase
MIDILMATYNGEKFLDTQIASIVNQTYTDWKLYIHDDGSNDSTKRIIQKWCGQDNRIVFVDDGICFHNPAQNFMHLLPFSTADFISFTDQDDYWLEYKLERMLENFGDSANPKLLVSSCFLWNTGKETIIKKPDYKKAFSLEQFIFLNGGLQGCAMMFNAALRDILLVHSVDYVYMHDHLISLVAFTFGSVVYINDALFLYRQYDGNVSVHVEESKLARLKQVVENSSVPVIYTPVFEGTKAFFYAYRNEIPNNAKKIFLLYLRLPSFSFANRFFLIAKSSFSLGCGGHIKLILKLLLRKFCSEKLTNA